MAPKEQLMPAYTNATQNIPGLFKAIMENHREQEGILNNLAAGTCTTAEWLRLKELRYEMQDFRRAAEKALSWNHNKGNTA